MNHVNVKDVFNYFIKSISADLIVIKRVCCFYKYKRNNITL